MSERQYTDREVAAIFEKASEADHTPVPAQTSARGLTLAALQEIGREIGIAPEAILRAALSLGQAGRPATRRFMGLTIGVGRTVEFDRPLSDADWEHLVADLRTTFEARGTLRYDGPFREWTNGNLHALLEPTANGHRLRLHTLKGDSRAMMSAGMAAVGVAAATSFLVAIMPQLLSPGRMTGLGFVALAGVGMFAAGAMRLSGWARLRSAQIDEIIERIAP